MTTKLTVLFAPGYGLGRLNASHGLAQELLNRGHRIVFAIDKAYGGQAAKYGFEEVLHSVDNEVTDRESEGDDWRAFVANNAEALKGNTLEIIGGYCVHKMSQELRECQALDDHYRSVVQVIRPDVIVVDALVCAPALITQGIPWVCLFSGAPLLCLWDNTLPPPFSGMPYKSDGNDWHEFNSKFNEILADFRNDLNSWYISTGAPTLASKQLTLHSPHLNVYVYPKELDYYSDNTLLPQNWLRVDSLVSGVSSLDRNFSVPNKLANKPGKLVLVNMGRVGIADKALMSKLVANLSHSGHRYIVVTGALGDQLELADNMWGKPKVKQLEVLPHVDLVITDGSNQTVVEAIHFGKPLIILPLFGDHFENSQRVKELALGLTLSPYTCGMTSLVASVDALIDDMALKRRLAVISKRIQASTDRTRAAQQVENIVPFNAVVL